MKIKLEGIDKELTLQEAKDLYDELKELFDPPVVLPPGHLYDPMKIQYYKYQDWSNI